MSRLRKQICVLLLVSITPSKAVSQLTGNGVTVSGVVLAEGNNQAIEHVAVRLCDGGGNLMEETTTTQSGEFSFRGVRRGRYILTFEAIGYHKTDFQLDLSYTSDKGMTIYMKPIAKQSAAGPTGSTVSAHELSMPQAARELVGSGKKKLYVDKKPEAGLQDFHQAVTQAPNYYEAYREIAIAYLTMGKADEARENFRKSIELSHDTYGDADVGLGTLLVEKGEAGEGERAIRRGVELNPNSWMGFYELGKLDLGRDHLDLALKSAERARALAPNAPIVYRLLANIHVRQKNYKDLLGDLDAYIKLDPDSPAGLRAAQMRQQIAQEIAKHSQASPGESKPQ
jgi:tetratricopeptide (TPR) repeat protein